MNANKVVSMVGRMPFSGIQDTRPAALRGALAVRRGDAGVVDQSRRRLREVEQTNIFFAAVGSVVLAANTYAAVKSGSPVDCAAHSAEAVLGGLMLLGHGASAFAEHTISGRIGQLAAATPPPEEISMQAYPDFTTEPPRGSWLVDKLVVYGGVGLGICHPMLEFLSRHLPTS